MLPSNVQIVQAAADAVDVPSVHELADQFACDRAWMARSLIALEQDGLVHIARRPSDGHKAVTITPAGCDWLGEQ